MSTLFVLCALLLALSGFVLARGRASEFHWPSALTKIFASRNAHTLSPPAPALSSSIGDVAVDVGNNNDVVLTLVAADVSVTVSPSSVLEDGGTNLDFTFTRTGDTTGTLTVNFSVGGTAGFGSNPGDDYTQTGAATFSATSGTVTFAADSATAVVSIDPTADTDFEPDETVVLTATAGAGYNPVAPTFASGTITNDDFTIIVTKTADTNTTCLPGDCSLREAINAANTTSLATINFDIPGAGVQTITPLTPLPTITSPVVIDAYTQSGASANDDPFSDNAVLMIELNGASAGPAADGFVVTSGSTVIRGFVINRFLGNGIKLASSWNEISGNFIGTDADGTSAGTNRALGNQVGVLIDGPGANEVGCTFADMRNIISGNHEEGVKLINGANFNFIQGNFIGTDKTGTLLVDVNNQPLGNGGAGVEVYQSSSNNVIGAELPLVPIDNAGRARGDAPTQNQNLNLSIDSPPGNIIAGNGGDGVEIGNAGDLNNVISQNSIYSNGGLGIDLGPDGVTPNDLGTPPDTDSGANNLQNFPALTSAVTDSQTTITGSLDSTPNTAFLVEFFVSDAKDPSGNGEGQTFLDVLQSGLVSTTDANGHLDISFNPNDTVSAGKWITATATDPDGNTSEFSNAVQVGALAVSKSGPSPTLVVGQNSTYTIRVTNNDVNADATSATVEEAISVDLDLISATGTNWNCTPAAGSGALITICTFSGGTITADGGTSTIDIVIKPKTGTAGNAVTNRYSIDPTGSTNAPDPTTCTAADTPTSGCGAPVGPDTIAGAKPTATNGNVSGQIVDSNGNPVEGAAVRMTGTQNRLTVTDAQGNYHFDNVETNGFYTVVPTRANFSFSPSQRSFSALGQHTDAAFNATPTGSALNPLDSTEYFVRQQYLDFLGREPDESGFNFWVNNIESCGADAQCRDAARINTSAAFFLSIEFQQTGYLVYRTYQAAYGDMPNAPVPIRLNEFKPDTAEIGNGVVVLQSGWETVLENNKRAYAAEFVQRARFTSVYPTTTPPAEFVDRLFANAGVTPSASDRTSAMNEFGAAGTSADVAARGRALRRVAENSVLAQQEFNQAFVLMQYFGYLRRDANSGPDQDFTGYNFWLDKLNTFNGNFQQAEMVKAFLVSGEYRGRFPR